MILLYLLINLMPGEKLQYVAKYSVLNLGSMTLEIMDTSLTQQDLQYYYIRSVINSASGLKWLFSLNDTIEVISTVKDLLPLLSREIVHEGKYHNRTFMDFNHENDSVTYNDSISVFLSEDARDLISFWYYLRTIPLIIGDTISINIHKSMENYNIRCAIIGYETIETPAGIFNTILVKPQTAGKGIFGSSGSMSIWYSDDADRYPVQILAKMKIGTVYFKLIGVKH